MSSERQKFIAAAGEGLKVAYETLGLTVEQIAEQQELEVSEVRAVLWQVSRKFKQDTGAAIESSDEIEELYKDLAKHSSVDAVREKALRFLINEKRGRNDVPVELMRIKQRAQIVNETNLAMNLANFNEEMRRIRNELNAATSAPAPLEVEKI